MRRLGALVALLACLPLAACPEAGAVTLRAFGAMQAGDSLRLTATFMLDPTVDSGAAVFRVKTLSKRVKLSPVAAGASASFPLPAEGETVTGYLDLTLWKTGTTPVTVTDSVRYTQPVKPIVPPIINGFTAEQASAILDSSPLIHYASYYPSPTSLPCHAEMRQYAAPGLLLLVPPAAERPACDTVLAPLGLANGSLAVPRWNAQVVAWGRAQPDSIKARWREGYPYAPSRVAFVKVAASSCTLTDPYLGTPRCPDAPLHAFDWPSPDSTAGHETVWLIG